MLEEQRQQQSVTDRSRNLRINQQVVKLLQQKTIPLNKVRYRRLQTITKISPKYPILVKGQITNNSTPQLQMQPRYMPQPLPRVAKARTSRGHAMCTADMLINRLKNLKDLKQSSLLLLKDERAGRCWQALRNSIIQSQQVGRSANLSTLPTEKSLKIISQGGRRKRENLLQLAEKAERHLRKKKHELKQRHCQEEQYMENRRMKPSKPSQIQLLLSSLRDLKAGQAGQEKQLQLQLLRDIRETMLQQKINRIKKDINHKKIVQLR